MSDPARLQWAYSLRAAATVAVIILHVSVSVEDDFGTIPFHSWLAANIYDTAVRWCVPMFVMLTGTFALNNYGGDLKIFLGKTFKRVVVPFAFWSLIYLFYYNGADLFQHQMNLHAKAALVAGKLASGTAVHLWFVYMILGMYFLIPIFNQWVRHDNKNEQIFFISLWFLFLFIQPLWDKYDISFDISYFSGFIGYLVLGNFLFKRSRKSNVVFWIIIFIGAITYTCIRTFNLSASTHEMNENYMENFTPNIAITCVSVYLLFKDNRLILPASFNNLINKLSEHSYGIYLAHILVLDLLFKHGITYSVMPVAFSIPLITILCLSISYAAIYLLKKIPYLRTFAG